MSLHFYVEGDREEEQLESGIRRHKARIGEILRTRAREGGDVSFPWER